MSPDETGVPPTVRAWETQVKRLSFLEQRVHRALVLTGLAGVGKPSPVPPLWREGNRRLPWIFSGPSPIQSSGVEFLRAGHPWQPQRMMGHRGNMPILLLGSGYSCQGLCLRLWCSLSWGGCRRWGWGGCGGSRWEMGTLGEVSICAQEFWPVGSNIWIYMEQKRLSK